MSVAIVCQIIQEHQHDPRWLVTCAQGQAQRIYALNQQVQDLTTQCQEQRDTIQALNEHVAQLQERLNQAECEAKRQAAPFRRRERKGQSPRRRPGRGLGHPGAYRPRPEHVDHQEQVPLPACPTCGCAEAHDVKAVVQYIEEIPPVQPVVTELTTYEGTCVECGERFSSDHPLKVSHATGAAGTHLGPRALAVGADLNKHRGLPMRKTCAILQTLFGLHLTPGGLSQALDRVAQRLEPDYEVLIQELRNSAVAYGDETSWWIGEPAWLWVFTTPELTCYVVDETRAREVITATLGTEFAGVLVSDCLASYDEATRVQHKCYAHHFKAIAKAMGEHPQGGQGYLEHVRALLVAAMALAGLDRASELFARSYHALQEQAHTLLATGRSQPQEEAVRARLAKQRDHLFTFLEHEGVDATNNLAERQLRPAVIARKLSCGNKTRNGADTFQVLASLAATCDQRGQSFLEQATQACRRAPPSRQNPGVQS